MAKSEKAEQASSKPNRGQDEKTHEFINESTGEIRTATQREFRGGLRDEGFRKIDTDAPVEPAPVEDPAEPPVEDVVVDSPYQDESQG